MIGILIVANACVKVANLPTAQALRRTRELGIRKRLGAGPGHVLHQLMTETLLQTAGSTVAALLLPSTVMPTFGMLVDRPLSLDVVNDPWLWPGSLVLVALTTLASGLELVVCGCTEQSCLCTMSQLGTRHSVPRGPRSTAQSKSQPGE